MPLIKWAGGKAKLASRILTYLDADRPYVEPFLGGGAVFFAHACTHRAALSDVNGRLIGMYQALQTDVDGVIDRLSRLPWDDTYKAVYYEVREAFNAPEDDPYLQAARFLWLNRACYNGLYRENKLGIYNVPVGRMTMNPYDPEHLRGIAYALQRADLSLHGYSKAITQAPDGACIYADPPYFTGKEVEGEGFTTYSADGFDLAAQRGLAAELALAAARGCTVVVSNADVPAARELYGSYGFTIETIEANRSMGRKTESRRTVTEILAYLGCRKPTHTVVSVHNAQAGVHVDKTYISRAESNLKGGVAVNLHPLTLIVGRNAHGKSAVVNTVELALTGIVSDVIGRDVVNARSVNSWMVAEMGDGAEVYATVQIGQRESTYRASVSPTGGLTDAKHKGKIADAFPLRAVQDGLAGNVETVRTWLFTHATRTVTEDQIAAIFDPELWPMYKAQAATLSGTPVARLIQIRDLAVKRGREKQEARNNLVAYVDRRCAELAPRPSAALLAGLVERAAAWTPLPNLTQAQTAMQNAIQAFEIARSNWYTAREGVTADDAKLYAAATALTPLISACDWHTQNNRTNCALCGTATPTAVFATRAVEIREMQLDAKQRGERAARAAALEQQAINARTAAQEAIAACEAAQAMCAIHTETENVTHALAVAQALEMEWKRIDATQIEIETATEQIERATRLHAACKQATAALLENARAAFVARVNTFLLTEQFDLILEFQDQPVCRVGFRKGERLRTALSASEWARMNVALALATHDPTALIQVIVPEDRGFDATTLVDVLTGIRDGLVDCPNVQVLWPTVIMPDTVPAGWHVVHVTGDPEHASTLKAPRKPRATRKKKQISVETATDATWVEPADPTDVL
jgi:DNA adenine methylase